MDTCSYSITIPLHGPPGFAPRDAVLDLEDEENGWPVPTEREDGDRLPLQVTVGWLIFVALVFVLKSRPVVDCVKRIRTKLGGTE